MSTAVPRVRPPKLTQWKFGGDPHKAFDPPKYTRKEIGFKARHLHNSMHSCSDLIPRPAYLKNGFVRYMIQWWGEMFVCD
jgi:hypothetical protein